MEAMELRSHGPPAASSRGTSWPRSSTSPPHAHASPSRPPCGGSAGRCSPPRTPASSPQPQRARPSKWLSIRMSIGEKQPVSCAMWTPGSDKFAVATFNIIQMYEVKGGNQGVKIHGVASINSKENKDDFYLKFVSVSTMDVREALGHNNGMKDIELVE
ncbi:hypothetical protein ACP70R_023627 [Stipagrostis hirtigluma subsp. patula]